MNVASQLNSVLRGLLYSQPAIEFQARGVDVTELA